MLPRVGVFGTTTIIKSLVPILKSNGFLVVALWGRTKEQADELGKELGVTFTTQKVDEVLLYKDVDFVIISCSPHLQSQIAVKALNIGKHVLCGTPSGPGQVEVLRMVNAARYYPRLMSLMCHSLRFLPTVTKMKNLIQNGFVGDINICEVRVHYQSIVKENFDWTCDELMGGGVLNTIGCNIIDIITYLTSQKAIRVHGMLKTYHKQTDKIKGIREITSDDYCSFQMELEKGACATVTLNSHMPGPFVQEIIISGSKARLTVRGADLYGQAHDKIKEDLLQFEPVHYSEEERLGISQKVRREIPNPYLKGMIRSIEAVRVAFGKEEVRQSWCSEPLVAAATFEDSLYTQTVIDAIRTSSKSKEWEKVVMMKEEPNPFLTAAMRKSTFSLH
ncbi:hypothetical protein LOTGIDRAFT_114597 [Lottia gigantea]|uniref:Gfo/Idh/MocA-like oxidoreductase N-terminal domain-containing protein n=1 Tax=Lottia gigantea TaxID=225164 RepID=V4AM48_LOTGI|nr:hypothetical protein LOTGIDRAFT_114597 [Lottia gigantea]ESO98212.1 hypothetical protein LOTGIDRAFT_114597 [Lottia gigantea]